MDAAVAIGRGDRCDDCDRGDLHRVRLLIYFRVLARAGATNLLLVTFLIPVSAILLGVLFLGETLELRHMLGMAAIAVGLAAIDGRPQQILARRFNRVASRA
jgi:hypothetical protein